jgi:hypothetical protein
MCPFKVRALAGKPQALRSFVSGSGLTSAVCLKPSEFVVVLRDSEGNDLVGCASLIAITIRHLQKQSYGDFVIEDKHDGSYHVQYVVAFPGTLELTVEIRDPASRKASEPLIGSPFSVSAVAQQSEFSAADRALAELLGMRPVRPQAPEHAPDRRPCLSADLLVAFAGRFSVLKSGGRLR